MLPRRKIDREDKTNKMDRINRIILCILLIMSILFEITLFLFDSAQQRIFARFCEVHCFLRFHVRYLVRVNAGDSFA